MSMKQEQAEFFVKLADSLPKLRDLANRANVLKCTVLKTGLEGLAIQLAADLDIQKRALSDDPKIRAAALAQAQLPFRVL